MSAETINLQADLGGLNYTLKSLVAVLKVDSATVTRIEAGQLAADIATGLGPKTISKGNKSVKASVKRSFFPLADGIQPWTGKQAGKGDIQWLFATTSKNFSGVVGVKRGDLHLNADAKRLSGLRSDRKEAAWKDLGRLTKQTVTKKGKNKGVIKRMFHATLINRKVVRASVFKTFMAQQVARVGQSKAAFAYTANELLRGLKRYPEWVTRHFKDKAGGKAIMFDGDLLNSTKPSIAFGSRAKGVISNPAMQAVFHGAIKNRSRIMAEKLKKIFSGYSYDLRTGQTFKEKSPKE